MTAAAEALAALPLVDHAKTVQHDLNGSLMVLTVNADMIAGAPGATDAAKRQAGRIKAAAAQVEAKTRPLLDRIRGKGDFPQPQRKLAGAAPCGECHLQPAETCDICGVTAP